MNNSQEYSVVIATKDRADFLLDTLKDLSAQTWIPTQVVVVDSSVHSERPPAFDLDLMYLKSPVQSSAQQRNMGADVVETDLVCFLDDDVQMPADHFERLLKSWSKAENIAVLGGRIEGLRHSVPGRLLKAYYAYQAGYRDNDYGGHIFGPAITCVPTYCEDLELIEGQWMSSTCLITRMEFFNKERFPDFSGYSWGEDVHLSTRLAKYGKIYFHRDAVYKHFGQPTPEKNDLSKIAVMQMQNQFRIATECLGRDALWVIKRLKIHAVFVALFLLKSGNRQCWNYLTCARNELHRIKNNL